MSDATRGHRAGLLACTVAAVLLITACSSGPGEQNADPAGATEPPEPSPAATSEDTSNESSSSDEADADSTDGANEQDSDTLAPPASGEPEAMEASDPVSVSIPEIDLESELMDLGLQANGMVEVPPFDVGSPAGWYTHGPTPGEVGPSVLLGHLNAIDGGPGVFAQLPDLQVGDTIETARDDGSTARFTVYRTEHFVKEDFPTLEVYGNTDEAELRLITCDNLNQETGLLEDNYVVYATLET